MQSESAVTPNREPYRLSKEKLFAIAILCVIGIFLAWRALTPKPKPPFELSFWYWHSPFALDREQLKDLKQLGVKQLFVRAGTFSSDGTNLVLVLPQSYRTKAPGLKIHQVFNFDAGVVKHFGSYDLARMAHQIAERIDIQERRGLSSGLDIAGIQFDFDCPTRLLPRYAELVKHVRSELKAVPNQKVSATALMSWLGTRGADELSRQVDFLVPQAYEGETGRTLETMRPVSDEEDFRRRIGAADRLSCPFYVGIPAYGHCFLFDSDGNLANIFRQFEPGDLFRHPAFGFIAGYAADRLGRPAKSSADSVGEEILKFRAIRPAQDGEGLGDLLGYTVPTPALLTRMLKAAKETQSSRCLGGIVYRMPEGNSEETIPMGSLMAALSGKTDEPILRIRTESDIDSFDVIESARALPGAPKDLNLEIENVGGATFISPDAAEVEVHLSVPGIEEVRSRDMDLVGVGEEDSHGFHSGSPASSSDILFTCPHLATGQKLSVGPIQLLSSQVQHIVIRWKARGADGFHQETGTLELVR